MKSVGGEEIVYAVRLVLKGEIAVSNDVTPRIMHSLSTGTKSQFPLQSLSDRELEVFIAIGQEKATKCCSVPLQTV
jgi:DNA-binding NarL/FixJ family response regulator